MARSFSRAALLGATFLAGFSATQAAAQTAAAPDQTADAAGSSNEIVVTGSRRRVTLQNAPINISAVSSEQIEREHIDDVRDLEREWRDALIAKDEDGLRRLIHPQFKLVGIRSTGSVAVNLEQWIEALKRMDIASLEVRVIE